MPAFDGSISLNLLLKLKESKRYEDRNHDLGQKDTVPLLQKNFFRTGEILLYFLI